MRAVKEWIGKTDDTPVPRRVRIRIFERCDERCGCCNRKIAAGEPWDLDHVTALVNDGENRESNLRPILREHHKAKTREDVALKSQAYKRRARHYGVKRAKRTIPGRKFDGTPIPARWR